MDTTPRERVSSERAVVGKAMESVEFGRGRIRLLVVPYTLCAAGPTTRGRAVRGNWVDRWALLEHTGWTGSSSVSPCTTTTTVARSIIPTSQEHQHHHPCPIPSAGWMFCRPDRPLQYMRRRRLTHASTQSIKHRVVDVKRRPRGGVRAAAFAQNRGGGVRVDCYASS